FLHAAAHHPILHSFPTRRSSDLDRDRLLAGLLAQSVPVDIYGSGWSASPSGAGSKQNGGEQESSYLGRELVQPGSAKSYALASRSEEHTSELQSRGHLVCRLLLE